MWHVQTLFDQVSPSFGIFCINQHHNSYWLWTTVWYIQNFLWDPLWRALLSPDSIYAVHLRNLPDPLTSLHPALCNRKLIFINRLPCPLASSWGSPKEEHWSLENRREVKLRSLFLLHLLISQCYQGIFSSWLPFPKYHLAPSVLGVEMAPHFANLKVLNYILLVSLSTLYTLVSDPLIKLPSIYPNRLFFKMP